MLLLHTQGENLIRFENIHKEVQMKTNKTLTRILAAIKKTKKLLKDVNRRCDVLCDLSKNQLKMLLN